MFRLRAVLAALLFGAPLAANAAEITRIASSFDEDDPFDLILDAKFHRTQTHTKIVREELTGTQGLIERPEVWHKGSDTRLDINLAIGLYKDFEFSFGIPIVLQQNDNYAFTSATSESTSTIIKNTLNPDGTQRDTPLTLFPIDSNDPRKRGGLGNMRFGMAYAFFNQNRDDTKPMWIVGLDYEAPTAKLRDPSQDNRDSVGTRGNVGDRVHKYTLYTSFSRKVGVADPYFKVHYTIPVQGPGIYSNCFNLESQGTPGNCFTGKWSRKETGIQAPTVAGIVTGAEFTAFSDKTKSQKFALDIRAIGTYIGEGRYYNELSAALGKLLATQEYFQIGGQFGATASAGEAFTLRASGTFLYNTDHGLTNEDLGVKPEEFSDPSKKQDINPNFDFRYDLVSRRFRAVESTSFRLELSAAFAF
ncbi:hypothetical protein [Hyalangium minutum]|uniref:Uncharacterized protein n=1 Tax=Hyalangium minutum TaxID=394096 RepID=A0A085WRK3_9BACT|nr:hypothetical protein [Hyalangium minutum]KFE70316.1 hypothetical protein DB31_5358 [Hyalangium minutum]